MKLGGLIPQHEESDNLVGIFFLKNKNVKLLRKLDFFKKCVKRQKIC